MSEINTVRFDESILSPVLLRIRGVVRERLEEEALKIIEEEVAKFSLSVSKFITISDYRDHLVIEVRKNFASAEKKK